MLDGGHYCTRTEILLSVAGPPRSWKLRAPQFRVALMTEDQGEQGSKPQWSWREVALMLLGIVLFLIVAAVLYRAFAVPFDTSYRVGCALVCLGFIAKLGSDYPGERWPWIGLGLSLLVDVALFFTPLVDRPASRGELIIFGATDAVVVLTVRIVTYRVANVHQRAMRQQMILALLVAVVVSGLLFAAALAEHRHPRTTTGAPRRA